MLSSPLQGSDKPGEGVWALPRRRQQQQEGHRRGHARSVRLAFGSSRSAQRGRGIRAGQPLSAQL